ncbi:PIN domain-containing protein [Actinotalea solisilvae]|uniref:PIN domain-containing protein n=1 Tax=Actinotalea solisilvae TaxID=2072922 RepID=UPI0018F11D13|nr:PIN domain-containing protein [Actinotalea solisilvae]
MIAFLDANILMQDFMCAGAVWRVLAHAPESWSLRLFTSEVAVAEAVAGYDRAIAQHVEALDKTARSWGRLGAGSDADDTRAALRRRGEVYREHLQSSLVEAGVSVLPTPAVSHSEVIARSVARRRPCDERGDGYRDTLVWLSFLELVRANAEEESFVFVTTDTDFMDDLKTGFHEHLKEDLGEQASNGRVRLRQVLGDIPLALAQRSGEGEELKSLRDELKAETVGRFVESLLKESIGEQLSARACALPRASESAMLESVGAMRGMTFTVRGSVSDDQAVADFLVEADTEILIRVPLGAALGDAEAVHLVAQGPEHAVYTVRKPLLFAGMLQFGRFDKPLGGEVSRVTARPDDPGRLHWVRGASPTGGLLGFEADVTREMLNDLKFYPTQDVFDGLHFDLTQDLFKDLKFDLTQDLFKDLKFDLTQDLFKDLKFDLTQDLFKDLKFDLTQGLFKDLKLDLTHGVLEGRKVDLTQGIAGPPEPLGDSDTAKVERLNESDIPGSESPDSAGPGAEGNSDEPDQPDQRSADGPSDAPPSGTVD